ncbi:MAG: DNA replication and repair protein RecF, partial [SAR202 cluster bacterium]|nr:DNA replication and repair protein RecF [SAR202 cluster bacterium]
LFNGELSLSHLAKLQITNFRNLLDVGLSLHNGMTVFHGDNGEGKTSLLEAIYYLSVGRSFKAENEREVVNQTVALTGGQCVIHGQAIKLEKEYQIVLLAQSYPKQRTDSSENSYLIKKQIRVNKVAKTASDLFGTISAVVFHVDDIRIIEGSPSVRRKFLDILISQSDREYLTSLRRYQKVLQQRNKLLKSIREKRANKSELVYWDNILIEDSYVISQMRQTALIELSQLLENHFNQLGSENRKIDINLKSTTVTNKSKEEFVKWMEAELLNKFPAELKAGTSLVGPHRDDFKILVNGFDIGRLGSRGEKKILALALKMSEASFISDRRDDNPIILLDDVLSELDENKRRCVLNMASIYGQSLITTTDLNLISSVSGINPLYAKVAQGKVYTQ